jgi:hypothetical protein
MSKIFNVQTVGAFIGLIQMALAPVVFRWWKSEPCRSKRFGET